MNNSPTQKSHAQLLFHTISGFIGVAVGCLAVDWSSETAVAAVLLVLCGLPAIQVLADLIDLTLNPPP